VASVSRPPSSCCEAAGSSWGARRPGNGTPATAKAGCLIVVNANGRVVETFHGGLINGRWDMTALDGGSVERVFVTIVLNATVKAKGSVVHGGTVVRIVLRTTGVSMPRMTSEIVIGSRFGEKIDPAALVVGPTGLALGANGTLYVVDTVAGRITAIPGAASRSSSAGIGSIVSHGAALHAPLGLTLAPNGDILTVNGGDGIVETTPSGVRPNCEVTGLIRRAE
jgi:sugar lactone lactonase YvrE